MFAKPARCNAAIRKSPDPPTPSPVNTRPVRLALVTALNAAYVLVSPESPLVGGAAAFARGVWHHVIGRYGSG